MAHDARRGLVQRPSLAPSQNRPQPEGCRQPAQSRCSPRRFVRATNLAASGSECRTLGEIVIGRVDLPRDVHSGYSWWRRAPVQAKRRVPNSRSRKLYLASGSSSYTPGSILKVDGARILS